MSSRLLSQNYFSSRVFPHQSSIPPVTTPWVRPVDWLTLPTLTDTDQKFVGLHAVFEDSNFIALSAAGDYTVDWGDGLIENFAANVVAQHIYDYTNITLAGTECSRGYKQAIVVVTPQVGQNLTELNLHKKHNQAGLNVYNSGFVDIAIAGAFLTNLLIGVQTAGNTTQVISISLLEQMALYSNSVLTVNYLFFAAYSLKNIPQFNAPVCTNFSRLFYICRGLQSIGSLNTAAGINFSGMFTQCFALQTVPLFDTALGTDFTDIFTGCYSLQTVPLLNTAAGINFSGMFSSCYTLQTVPLLNTAAGTNFTNMLSNCYALQTAPLFDTALGTNFTNMFSYCYTLQTVPLLNTTAGTNFSYMFNNCYSLQTVPLFDTALGTNFSYMFSYCLSLQTVPLLNTAAGTNFTNMFNNCYSLITGAISGCQYAINYSIKKLDKTALENIFTNLGKAAGAQTITITNNWGALGENAPISKSGISIAGSNTITMADTAGITAGMQITGTGSPLTTPLACAFVDAANTVGITAHGLVDGDNVSFAAITSTTGIDTYTPYFVINATADTFQLALTIGGAPIDLITDGTGTMLYIAKVVSVIDNVSVTLDKSMTASGIATFAYRLLTTGQALLKGWTVSG